MKLNSVEIREVFGRQPAVQLVGVLESANGRCREVLVEVPDEFRDFLSTDGNAWLVLMTALGAVEGEDVEITLPVDPLLLAAMPSVTAVWKQWRRNIYVPKIKATAIQEPTPSDTGLCASFFSGGIDSLFTALRHGSPPDYGTGARCESHLLIRNYHADRISELDREDESLTHFRAFAESLGKRFVPLSSNVMVFSERMHDRWGSLTHGAALAFLAYVLERRISKIIVGSSHTFGELLPWGSHPLTDPLFSSSGLQFVHDGALYGRFFKSSLVASHAAARPIINVCDKTTFDAAGAHNCSRCQKCLRTMTALDVLGFRGASDVSFDWTHYSTGAFGRIFIKNRSERSFSQDLLEAARLVGRADIVAAIDQGERRSRRYRWTGGIIDRLRRYELVLSNKAALVRLRDLFFSTMGLHRRI